MTDDIKKDDVKVEEATEVAADAPVTEVQEEVKDEVKEVGTPSTTTQDGAEAPKAKKPAPSGKFKELIEKIENLSALELAELVKELEERFGVSAAAPMAMGVAPAAGGAEAAEEKSSYNVVMTAGGGNKIAAIKAVREILPDLGLKEAKDLVEGAPKPVKENVAKDEAEKMKAKLEEAGATVELQ
jgi:large subunit ribosomal protein L7/L12